MTTTDLARIASSAPMALIEGARNALSRARTEGLPGVRAALGFAELVSEALRLSKAGEEAEAEAERLVIEARMLMGEATAKLAPMPPEVKGALAGGPGKEVVRAPDHLVAPLAEVVSRKAALASVGLTKQRAAEHERLANHQAEVRAYLASTDRPTRSDAQRVAQGLAPKSTQPANFSSESVEWYTPAEYIEAARAALGGIDLDPATSAKANETVKAKRIFTREDNSLTKPWGGAVWLNPPYGDEDASTGAWVQKLVSEVEAGNVTSAVLLVNAVTDRKWFQPLWTAAALCFTDHRIKFYTPGGTPKQPVSGNVFAYWGRAPARFRDAFKAHGAIVQVMP